MKKRKISADIIADSTDSRGNRITTYILTYPRFIHGELMTHRMFSRNAASSRAIPFEKMVKEIEEDPFIPIAWQKHHKGMQGNEYLSTGMKYPASEVDFAKKDWIMARDKAVENAKELYSHGVTKQLCNRLLEPFQWMTTLVTATEFANFFDLRCPQFSQDGQSFKSKKDLFSYLETTGFQDEMKNNSYLRMINKSQAEIHIQALAEAMWDARNESMPKTLKAGEWHIPFGDKIDLARVDYGKIVEFAHDPNLLSIQIATARAARISYATHDGEIDYEKDIKLYDSLLESKHASPFEHCARVMTDFEYASFTNGSVPVDDMGDGHFVRELESVNMEDYQQGWCRNLRGFIPYRHIVNL